MALLTLMAGQRRGIGAVDSRPEPERPFVQQAVGILDGDLMPTRALPATMSVHVAVILDVAHDVEGVGIFQAVDQFAAFAAAVAL